MHPALPIELPTEPRRFRVHKDSYEPMDCTLHPDGRMTTVIGNETLRSALSLEDMLDMNWRDAEIEWDPVDEPASEACAEEAPVAVEAVPLFA